MGKILKHSRSYFYTSGFGCDAIFAGGLSFWRCAPMAKD
jgi:hypothetical protein